MAPKVAATVSPVVEKPQMVMKAKAQSTIVKKPTIASSAKDSSAVSKPLKTIKTVLKVKAQVSQKNESAAEKAKATLSKVKATGTKKDAPNVEKPAKTAKTMTKTKGGAQSEPKAEGAKNVSAKFAKKVAQANKLKKAPAADETVGAVAPAPACDKTSKKTSAKKVIAEPKAEKVSHAKDTFAKKAAKANKLKKSPPAVEKGVAVALAPASNKVAKKILSKKVGAEPKAETVTKVKNTFAKKAAKANKLKKAPLPDEKFSAAAPAPTSRKIAKKISSKVESEPKAERVNKLKKGPIADEKVAAVAPVPASTKMAQKISSKKAVAKKSVATKPDKVAVKGKLAVKGKVAKFAKRVAKTIKSVIKAKDDKLKEKKAQAKAKALAAKEKAKAKAAALKEKEVARAKTAALKEKEAAKAAALKEKMAAKTAAMNERELAKAKLAAAKAALKEKEMAKKEAQRAKEAVKAEAKYQKDWKKYEEWKAKDEADELIAIAMVAKLEKEEKEKEKAASEEADEEEEEACGTMPKIAHLQQPDEITPSKVKKQVAKTPKKHLANKGQDEVTPTKVKNKMSKTSKQSAKRKPKITVVGPALAKVNEMLDFDWFIRAEMSVHGNGRGYYSVPRFLKPGSIYNVVIHEDVIDSDADSADRDEFTDGKVVKASLVGPMSKFQGIETFSDMLGGGESNDSEPDDSEESSSME